MVLLECLPDRGVGGASDPEVAGDAVMDVEAIGAVVDLGDAQPQQLGQPAVQRELAWFWWWAT